MSYNRFYKVKGMTQDFSFKTKIFYEFGAALSYFDEVCESEIEGQEPLKVTLTTYVDDQNCEERTIMRYQGSSSPNAGDKNQFVRKLIKDDFAHGHGQAMASMRTAGVCFNKSYFNELKKISKKYDTSISEIVRVLVKQFVDYTK